jgi:hypothetical protein
MTTIQRVAQIFGWAFILIGLVGFFYTGTSMEAQLDRAPRLFEIFPVNVLHNLVHLGLGFLTPTMFGLVPIGGNDIWLHVFLALPLLYFGFTAREHPAGAARARV